VRAVLANTRGMTSIVGAVDKERVELTEAALDAIGPDPSADRARLLAHLAAEVTFTGNDDRRLALADEAEALARRVGDRRLLAWVLVRTGFAAVADDRWHQLVIRSKEAVDLADEGGDPALRVLARFWSSGAALTAGDIPTFERAREEMLAIAEEGSPTLEWMARTISVAVLLLRGRFDEAGQRNDDSLALGQQLGEVDAPQWWGAVATMASWCRGDTEMVDAVGAFADEYPLLPAWRAGHAWRLSDAGRLEEARNVVTQYNLDPAALGREPFPFFSAVALAHTARHLGDRELARRSMEALEPYLGCWTHFYIGTNGPVTWGLGVCALTFGDFERAVGFLEDALRELTAYGYEGLIPRLQLDLAETLLSRHAPGDYARAARLIDEVRGAAAGVGAPGLADQADRVDLNRHGGARPK
jgi:tetratricopeptide (TPR) repeat protein